MPMVRYYVIFYGQVQGVGFRYTLAKMATNYGITGWVRNRYDGSVEAQLQADENSLNRLILEIQNEGRYISVEDYSIKQIDIVSNEKGFRIKY